jgi:hypothetical protein
MRFHGHLDDLIKLLLEDLVLRVVPLLLPTSAFGSDVRHG